MFYNDYPIVLCHGFFGWGEGEGVEEKMHYWGGMKADLNLPDHLREAGRTVIYPSLGPVASEWDRACELWAILMGGTVDYGKVHSKKYGHERYGRTYPGLLKDWGKKGAHAKINILGHSFGGPTVMMFCTILENGSKEEIEGTKKKELSEFFKGGKGDWVHTCTTLSGVNNGTLLASNIYPLIPAVSAFALKKLSDASEKSKSNWDMFVEKYGMTESTKTLKAKRMLYKYAFKSKPDAIGFEMSVEERQEINKDIIVCPHTYYFARTAKMSKNILGKQIVLPGNFPLSIVASLICGTFRRRKLKKYYGVDKTWLSNDGFVSLPGQKAPFNLPSFEWDGKADSITAGKWHNCKPEKWDHLGWNGATIDKDTYYSYYDQMIDLFRSLPDA